MNVKEVVSKFLADANRIFVVSKKPTWEEFKRMGIIIAIGMIVIGMLGFIVQFIFAVTRLGL
jgi:protein transport protein SEC61 subunit gamma-like protein